MAIGSRAQSAKTYLEKYYKDFATLELDDLIKHSLKALSGSIQGTPCSSCIVLLMLCCWEVAEGEETGSGGHDGLCSC